MSIPRPFRRMAEKGVKAGLRAKLRLRGYSKEQAIRMVATLKADTIRGTLAEKWAKWGPTVLAILKAVLSLLPILLMLEAPTLPPITDQATIDMIELDEGTDEDSEKEEDGDEDHADGEKSPSKGFTSAAPSPFRAPDVFRGGEGSPEIPATMGSGGGGAWAAPAGRSSTRGAAEESEDRFCGYCVIFNTIDGKPGFIGPLESISWAQSIAEKFAEKRIDILNIIVGKSSDSKIRTALERIGS